MTLCAGRAPTKLSLLRYVRRSLFSHGTCTNLAWFASCEQWCKTWAKCLPMSSPPFPLLSAKCPWAFSGDSFRVQWCNVTKDNTDHCDAFCKALKSKLRVYFSSFSSWHCGCRGDGRLMSFIHAHTHTHAHMQIFTDIYRLRQSHVAIEIS